MKTYKALACLTLLAQFTFSAAAQSKLSVIDLQKVFDGYYKTKAAKAALNDRAALLEKDKK